MRRHTPVIAVGYYVQDSGGNWPRSISDLQERGYLRAVPGTGSYVLPETVTVRGTKKDLTGWTRPAVRADLLRKTVNFKASFEELYVEGDILRDKRNGERAYLIRLYDSSGALMAAVSMRESIILFEWALYRRKSTTAPGTTTRTL